MRLHHITLLTALPALVSATLVTPGSASQPASTYVVLLRSGSAEAGVARAEALGADVLRVYRHAIRGYAAALTPGAVAALRDDPAVESVTPNVRVHGASTLSTTQSNAPWGLDRIDQRSGLDTTYTYTATGSGVRVYVLDTGIRTTHAEFGGRAVSGFDAIDGGTADDCNGHGTHVAGTVGGSTYGVAKSVDLVAVRVLECDSTGDLAGIMAGVDWVTGHHAANPAPAVVNMSLAVAIESVLLDLAVERSIRQGITYVAAAGNFGRPGAACNVTPARVPDVITVGNAMSTDVMNPMSNYGPCVDWYAPGTDILSADNLSDTATKTRGGTSMATPHTAGVAAQYLELDPTATPAEVTAALSARLTQGVVDTPLDQQVGRGLQLFSEDDLLYSGF